ncbi:MAG TPA: hypothetical protein PK453_09620 [Leptospiraceae bacterium]|nr:hypothetical protein [Leptospiraceae bacterium]HMY65760.1 hypothetical protein [Leptospiraceae bacterium]HNF13917.1 hypothetical protein [Leptospiraceae bacterium]HNF24490.1 hypothetical protein [Leptospiraceae bacterium]HNH08389.1 hypothetical protein [Leptospiraceae bacterium]
MVKYFLFIVLFPNISYADRIFLTNDDRLSGEIWKQTPQTAIISCEHGNYKLISRNIRSVEYAGTNRYRLMLNTGESTVIFPVKSESGELIYRKENDLLISAQWSKIVFLRLIKK